MGKATVSKTSPLSSLLLLLVSTAIALALAEVVLRIAGYQPWQDSAHDNEVTLHEFDAVLGWRNMQGVYTIPPYTPQASEIHVTFLDHGLRQTSAQQANARDERPKMVVVGGSYTQGWAISNDETYPWKLQEMFPAYEVLNYGSGGYGTYQSLLSLEQNLPLLTRPAVIVYGFLDNHERRNVAPASWLEGLARSRRRGHVYVPYVTADGDEGLVRHAPESWAEFPLREQSAIAAVAEKAYMIIKTTIRNRQRREVTERLLLETQQLSHKHHARLVVLMLRAEDEARSHYQRFLRDNGITAIDCVYPHTPDLIVEGEGHPNSKMTSLWMSCLADSGEMDGYNE